jgi:hypothetical protein
MSRRREGRDLPEIVAKLFERARADFPDPQAVNRSLLELCRLYDPVSGGALMAHGLRRRIVEQLQEGRTDDADRALSARFDEYRQTFTPAGNASQRTRTPTA